MLGRRLLALGACVVMIGCGAPLHGGAGSGASATASPSTSAPPPPAVAEGAAQMHAFRGPLPTLDASCPSAAEVPISPGRPPDNKLPGYGYGSGPAYLTGQGWLSHAVWFSGEIGLVVVDNSYSGGVTASGRQINGNGTVSFGGSSQTIVVKPQPPQSYWRSWEGSLTFSNAPGCYEIDLTGSNLRERVTVQVEAGSPPG